MGGAPPGALPLPPSLFFMGYGRQAAASCCALSAARSLRLDNTPAAPTWVSNGHRGLGVSADLGPMLGMEEVDGKLLDLAVVQEGVYLS